MQHIILIREWFYVDIVHCCRVRPVLEVEFQVLVWREEMGLGEPLEDQVRPFEVSGTWRIWGVTSRVVASLGDSFSREFVLGEQL